MAVYTEVPDEELEALVARYGIGTLVSAKGIAEGVENSNYLLRTSEGTYILTLYEKRVDPQDLPFFLGLMDHLAAKNIPCPRVLHDRDGQSLQTLAGRPAALISFLDGIWPKKIKPFHCAEVGKALARLHLAGQDFSMTRRNSLSLDGWQGLVTSCADKADAVEPGLKALIETELAHLAAAWPSDLPVGVCHADLFQDNVFFLGENLSGIIDFYFACTDILAYDLAICLNAWCFERDRSFNVTKARLMLNGYTSVRPISRAEIAALPLLARGSALRFLLTRLYDWINCPPGALVVKKDPLEYRDYLRFHQGVGSAAAYGLA